jgi:hypothetical protein
VCPGVPPVSRPIPRFAAAPPLEQEPYGRWAERLGKQFSGAAAAADLGAVDSSSIAWFPQRGWNGRTYVPAIAPVSGGELFGYVSFTRVSEEDEPGEFEARVEFTDETAAANPDWQIDLSDDVIGAWRGPGGAHADVTLVWGVPLRRGAAIATAELGGETVDQCEMGKAGGFTLVTLDAVEGYGDTLFLEVAIWDRRGALLGTESLYESEESSP